MKDWKGFIEWIDQLALELVLADLSSPNDFEKFFSILTTLSSQSVIAGSTELANMLSSTASIVSSFKISSPKKAIDILCMLCESLKAVLGCLDRGEDPQEYINSFQQRMKEIVDGVSASEGHSFSEIQLREIPEFVAKTKDRLNGAEQILVALEKSPEDKQKIEDIFYIFFNLKVESNLIGFSNIVSLCSEIKKFLRAIRSDVIEVDADVSTALLKMVDQMRTLINKIDVDPSNAAMEDVGVFIQQLQAIRAKKTRITFDSGVHSSQSKKTETKAATHFTENQAPRIPVLDLSSGAELYMDFITEMSEHLTTAEKSVLTLGKTPGDQESINNIFRAFHTIKGTAGILDLQDIRTLAHEAETMLEMVRSGGLRFEGRVVELTLMSIDAMRKLMVLLQEQAENKGQLKGTYPGINIEINALAEIISGKSNESVGEILIKQGAITESELKHALKIQKEDAPDAKIGQILVATSAASAKQVEEALGYQKAGVNVGTSIRIQLEKLDSLIDMVGELVISESQFIQHTEILAIKEQNFNRNIIELDRITRNLHQLVMEMRLVPIGPVFQKMERLVHDLSRKLKKEVKIVLIGEDTEVDKNMAELVVDPLMHMVRNSLDHGIETTDVRIAKGKPAVGRLELHAYHKGSFVVVEVRDDGAGLNKSKIFEKAIERGIIKKGKELTDNQIYNLIFEAGFTTTENVTDISGRGVGMDVVRKNIDRLHGKISISSVEGKGATFSLFLPITLAIIEGIVIRVANERYILPITSVVEFIQPKESERILIYDQGEMYKVYDNVYPMIHLDKVFGIPGAKDKFEDKTICILDSDYGKACVVVDELLGQQQVVIKSMGKRLENINGISGAAILLDDRIGLILDANSLFANLIKETVH